MEPKKVEFIFYPHDTAGEVTVGDFEGKVILMQGKTIKDNKLIECYRTFNAGYGYQPNSNLKRELSRNLNNFVIEYYAIV